MRTFNGIDEVVAATGEHLGYSDWHEVTQQQVDLFAEATGDHQWIHVDPERAARETPFGGTIAHGYLTLSLLPRLNANIYSIKSRKRGVNYGSNKVRFTAPVPSGSRVRGHLTLKAIEPMGSGCSRLVTEATVEVEGSERPALVAETLSLVYE